MNGDEFVRNFFMLFSHTFFETLISGLHSICNLKNREKCASLLTRKCFKYQPFKAV